MHIQKSYKNEQNSLYIIPTPIGNLDDITIRSLNTLKSLDILYCEDKRVTSKLLNHFDIKVKLSTYNDHSTQQDQEDIKNHLLKGIKVGLVSDAGMPGISDPGFKLIKYLKNSKQNVVILPGPSAFLEPMIYFTHDNTPFIFKGFLSKNKSSYKQAIKEISAEKFNTIIYETPHRIEKTLILIKEEDQNNFLLITREISKIYETYIEGYVEEILDYVKENPLKGEIVLVIGQPNTKEIEVNYLEEIAKNIECGMSIKDSVKKVATDFNLSKNKIYNEFIKSIDNK